MKHLIGTLSILAVSTVDLSAAPPAWWSEQTTRILQVNGQADNYAPANLGQLKHVAKMAKIYLDAQFSEVGGAGAQIDSLVASFGANAGQTADNYAPVNLGQLKAVGKVFYEQIGRAHV